ncbi:MAG TPA: hypothetical protein VH440_03455 [Candidatus Limnocylindrales bacterium]|jgi:hypothetical protein
MTTRRTRRAVGVAAAFVLASMAAPVALAKEGIEIRLAAPIQSDAKPGDVVPLFLVATALTDAGEHPLTGTDIFLRLSGPTGATIEALGVEQRERGTYKVMIEVPAGGAARAEFGIHRSSTNGPADVVWPYDGVLVAAAIPAPVDPDLFKLPNQPGYQPATEGSGNGAGPALAADGEAAAPASQPPSPALDPRIVGAAAIGLVGLVGLAAAAMFGVLHRRRGDPAAI